MSTISSYDTRVPDARTAGGTPAGPAGVDPAARRVLDAALRCIARWGVAKTTLDDVATEARCSRATVYRLFPGGRDRLLTDLVRAEVDRFFGDLAASLDAVADRSLEELVVVSVTRAARALVGHEALQFVLAHEPEAVLPAVAFRRMDQLFALVSDFAGRYLVAHVGADEASRAAEWLARIVISYTMSPAADVDITDEDSVRRMVRAFVLPGLQAVVPIP